MKSEFTFYLVDFLPHDLKIHIIRMALDRYCLICNVNTVSYSICNHCILRMDPIYGHL